MKQVIQKQNKNEQLELEKEFMELRKLTINCQTSFFKRTTTTKVIVSWTSKYTARMLRNFGDIQFLIHCASESEIFKIELVWATVLCNNRDTLVCPTEHGIWTGRKKGKYLYNGIISTLPINFIYRSCALNSTWYTGLNKYWNKSRNVHQNNKFIIVNLFKRNNIEQKKRILTFPQHHNT